MAEHPHRQAEISPRSVGEIVNTWVQTIGIVIAACWGVYTFIFKEILVPRSAPVNITLNLELKRIEGGGAKGNLTAVEMKASATNPSTREIHLLPSAWIAYGIPVKAEQDSESNFIQTAERTLAQSRNTLTVQKYARPERGSIVAVGHLCGDTILKPGEHITRTIVFYLPSRDFDLLQVRASMPCGTDVDRISLDWQLEDGSLQPSLYRIGDKGEHSPLTDTERDCVTKERDLQTADASADISLWSDDSKK